MAYLNLIIALAGLIVALASFAWSWWLNRRGIKVSFKWVKSTNDDSIKLAITLSNLSSRTTMINSLSLNSGTSVISDNGYDYIAAETRVREAKLQAERSSSPFGLSTWNRITPPIAVIAKIHPDSPRSDSQNFSEPKALFGNSSLHYTYWLDSKDLPDKLVITSSNFIHHFHKTASFEIPAISNQVNESDNVQDKDD